MCVALRCTSLRFIPSAIISKSCKSVIRCSRIVALSVKPILSTSAVCRAIIFTCISPAPGPVLANYGLDTLRFVKPVGIGDTIRARLTCKRKIDRNKKDANGVGQGVVAWDVEVSNQDGDLVASYDILTLVAKKS